MAWEWIFNDSWEPYAERDEWLAAADCAISTHVEHLETRYSSRTRLLDCFWAGLPVVCTTGDDLAARVAAPLLRWLDGPPPPRPLGSGRGIERRPSERLRTGAYLTAAGAMSALHVKVPQLR